jgi:hypothetical protein
MIERTARDGGHDRKNNLMHSISTPKSAANQRIDLQDGWRDPSDTGRRQGIRNELIGIAEIPVFHREDREGRLGYLRVRIDDRRLALGLGEAGVHAITAECHAFSTDLLRSDGRGRDKSGSRRTEYHSKKVSHFELSEADVEAECRL